MLLFITPLEVAGKMGTESLELPLPYVQIWGQNWNIDVICVRPFLIIKPTRCTDFLNLFLD